MDSTCQKCQSKRTATVTAKCSDCCSVALDSSEQFSDGYAPDDMNIGGGDYVNFSFCLDCGQLQGEWPLAQTEVEKAVTTSEE